MIKIRLKGIFICYLEKQLKEGEKKSTLDQLDDAMERYVFHYLDIFSDKFEGVGEKFDKKIDWVIDKMITNESQTGNNLNDDYYFPESCMDEFEGA